MIQAQCRPAAVDDAHQRAMSRFGETDLDGGVFLRCKIRITPGERQTIRRIPRADAAHLEYLGAAFAIDGFEQPAAHMRFQPNEAASRTGMPKPDAAPPPAIDVARED
jgi:hypothetical protein